jgi:SAM-dependent methyltransferase
MKDKAFMAYMEESKSWLHKGRNKLIYYILKKCTSRNHKAEILEIGAGVGQNVEILSGYGFVDVLEIHPKGIESLGKSAWVRNIIDKPIPVILEKKYDIICAFDVIEHLEDDKKCVKWIFESLRPGGYFIATVPAYQWLFSDHDIALNHYRRYSRKSFQTLLPCNSRVILDGYFNTILFPAVVLTRGIKILQKRSVKKSRFSKQKVPQSIISDTIFYNILRFEALCAASKLRIPFGLTYYICTKQMPT